MQMRRLLLPALATLCSTAPAYAQINWHAPRQAGKVWERKIDENNREARNRSAEQQAQAEAAEAAWDAPLTAADLQGTLARNRAEYERRLRLGKGFADQWLDRTARMERFKRSENGAPANARADTPGNSRLSAACSADALPAAKRKRMETEYASRFRNDGKASADAWAHEQGRRFRQKLTAQGTC